MSRGLLEAQALVVPVGGWTAAINDGTAFNATVAAGTYSITTLIAAFLAALEAGSVQTYTIGPAGTTPAGDGEGGTGAIKIICSATVSITWTSTDLRDLLGYTGNLAGDTNYTGTYGVKGRWYPDCPMLSSYGSQDPGHTEGGPTTTVSPLGVTKVITRPTRVRMPGLRWSHVSAGRARQTAESGAPRSWERFVRETMFGAVSYFRPGGIVRLYWNADVLGTYTDYYPIPPKTTALEAADAAWRGLYAVTFEGMAV